MANQTNESDDQTADSEDSGRKSARATQATRKQSAEETEQKAREQAEDSESGNRRGRSGGGVASRRGQATEADIRAEQMKEARARAAAEEAEMDGDDEASDDEPSTDDQQPEQADDDSSASEDEGRQGPHRLEMEITEGIGETLDAPDREDIDPAEFGVKWLETVFDHMNYDIDIESRVEDDRIYFDATGTDAEVLLGVGSSKPRSVGALQTLLTAALGRYTESRRIFLDVGGFHEQRAERLETLAKDLRDNVERIGKAITVAGLKSHERRVVHNTLKEDNSVSTESEGDGIFRKINIKPSG